MIQQGASSVISEPAPGQLGSAGETAETAEQLGATLEALAFVVSRRPRQARLTVGF
jgi:hypothetical protein